MHWQTLKFLGRRPQTSQLRSWVYRRCYSSQNGTPEIQEKEEPKPLRILFCGSDEFSSASLRALHDEQRRDPTRIASIDVLCRPGKPSGRSLKNIRHVPIRAVAEELGLPTHERDTFTGWDLPKPQGESINIIIAVSFGLFVPPRILRSAEYGGLNVHPSLLPNFRGPSPLQYTILTGAWHCGVTLQTLHDTSFDNGTILAQTAKTPIPLGRDHCTYSDLLAFITPLAASLLLRGLRSRVFVPPLINARKWDNARIGYPGDERFLKDKELVHAPKITPGDKRISFTTRESAVRIERRYRALGRLWCQLMFDPNTQKRIIFEDMEVVPQPEPIVALLKEAQRTQTGVVQVGVEQKAAVRFMVMAPKVRGEPVMPRFFVNDGDAIIVFCKNREGALRVKKITVEGKGNQDASKVFGEIKEWKLWNLKMENQRLTVERKVQGDYRYLEEGRAMETR